MIIYNASMPLNLSVQDDNIVPVLSQSSRNGKILCEC